MIQVSAYMQLRHCQDKLVLKTKSSIHHHLFHHQISPVFHPSSVNPDMSHKACLPTPFSAPLVLALPPSPQLLQQVSKQSILLETKPVPSLPLNLLMP